MKTTKLAVLLATAGTLLACEGGPLDPGRILAIDVTPAEAELTIGDTTRLEAEVTSSGQVTGTIAWTSSNPDVATVDSTGLVQARGFGTARVRAVLGSVAGEAEIRVAAWDLVFHAFAGGSPFAETLVLRPGSGDFPERLFPVGRYARDAAGSPDGARVAYVVRDENGYADLWVANRDGSGARPLVTGGGDDEWPAWSPDGGRIAFQSDRAGLSDIWVIDLDGTGLRRLTTDPLPGVTAEVNPAWSPDGQRIAFAGNEAGSYDIYTIRPDGTDRQRITSSSASHVEPTWSPDGEYLAAAAFNADEWDIVILARDGGQVRRFDRAGAQRAPAWRPDGRTLTFVSRATLEEPWQVWTIGADGSYPQQETPASFTGGHRPTWLKRR